MFKIIWIGAFTVLGVLLGNGAVYVFNRLPASWLCDYGEVPKEDLLMRQRINSTPWKVIFSCLLVACGVYLGASDPMYAAAAILLIWFLILISIADAKYMIVPDQLCVMAALCSIGFINYHESPLDMLYGALAGGLVMLAAAAAGRFVSKKDTLGTGDVKLMASLGFVLGFHGTVICIIGASILSAMAFSLLILWKKISMKDYQPLGPYISASAVIYILVIWPAVW